ncbi:MAG: hypothetical protein EA366_08690 [Spirulina sp. DLM2.Bin59]|nr:MAG: hypothetical protein EA366_08690 [Spirulina sp. DLM2.Bin59]
MQAVLIGIVTVTYIWGVWQFWRGYGRTNFQPSLSQKVTLALLWPALLVINKSYRKNFQKALRG